MFQSMHSFVVIYIAVDFAVVFIAPTVLASYLILVFPSPRAYITSPVVYFISLNIILYPFAKCQKYDSTVPSVFLCVQNVAEFVSFHRLREIRISI